MRNNSVIGWVALCLIAACGTGERSGAGASASAAKVEWPTQDTTNTVANLYRLTLGPAAATVPTCAVQSPVFGAGSVGPVTTAMPAADFMKTCPNAKLVWTRDDNDNGGKGILVRLGAPIVLLMVDGGTDEIYSVETADTSARTAQGVGPATSFQALKDKLGAATLSLEQCAVFASFADASGIKFRITPTGLAKDRDCAFIERIAKNESLIHPRTLIATMSVDVGKTRVSQAASGGTRFGAQSGSDPKWLCKSDTIVARESGLTPTGNASGADGALVVALSTGQLAVFPDCPGAAHNELRGYFARARVHVIEQSLEESGGDWWLLMHDSTGRIWSGAGRPSFSSDSAYIMSWGESLFEGDWRPGGLVLWAASPDSLREVFRIRVGADFISPEGVVWTDARTIDFWRVKWKFEPAARVDSTRARLVLEGDVWREVKP